MRLIGINGFKRSGKDTTFQLIQEIEFKAAVVERVGFADKLKIMAAKALGFVNETDERCIERMDQCKESWDIEIADNGRRLTSLTGREYLQWFGGEARNVFGDTFWIDQCLPTPGSRRAAGSRVDDVLEERYPGVDILCVTDVRYPNEAQRILDLGGEVWEIVKPGIESDGHGSEIPLAPELVTVKLLNDGSVEDLRSLVAASL